jgi:ABC-type antimicrobial peptide transport system permease subunit
MILKSLLGRKTRTLLTILGIAVGVAAVVALGTLSEGFSEAYGTLGSGSGADVLVMQDDALDIVFSAVDQEIGGTIGSFPEVAELAEMVYAFAGSDASPYFIVYGYDPDQFALERFKIVEGEPLSRHTTARGGKPLLLGRAAARDLEKTVGDSFSLYESVYRIVGIYETGEAFEDGAAVVLLEDAQEISGKPRQVNAFLLKLRPDVDADRLRARIEQRYKGLTTTTSASFADEQDMLQYMDAITWSVSLVALVIGGVGVMNTMLMSVFERTHEFGVLRAIGWRAGRVLRMVLGESLLVSAAGGGIGIGLGLLAAWGVKQVPVANMLIPDRPSVGLFLQGMGVALGLGVIGGTFPAWRAGRLAPIEAIHAEGGAMGQPRHIRHVRSSALRNVLRQPVRTLLTIVGIGVAMTAIVLLGAMGDGLVTQMDGMVGGGGAHLVGIEAGGSIDLSKIDEDAIRRINTMPGVRAAEGFLTGYTVVGDLPFFIVYGYAPRGLAIREFKVVEGEPLTTNRQILLGAVAAENLKMGMGQTIRIFGSSFKIVGIYETGVPFQDGGGVMTLRDAQRLFGQPRKVSFMGVWLEDPGHGEALIDAIEARFPEIDLAKSSEFAEGLTDIEMMEGMTWGISAMALVVGGLGMTNTMVMSVYERTREIGVLRALGWRQRRVLGMIVRESVILSLLGGVAGTIAGVVLGLLLNRLPVVAGVLRLEYHPPLFIQAVSTALILGAIGGLYPAWRATRLRPVEALRYE